MAALRTSLIARLSRPLVHYRTLFSKKGDTGKVSQSKVLGDVEFNVFELQVHNVKPKYMDNYLKSAEEQLVRVSEKQDNPAELIGSWTTEIGPSVDQAGLPYEVWQFINDLDQPHRKKAILKDIPLRSVDSKIHGQLAIKVIWDYPKIHVWQDYQKAVRQQVASRSSQILVAFGFWDTSAMSRKDKKGLYELRTYTLKPGGMIEWGAEWRNGIKYRQPEEAVGGWFTQIGEMHVVHHLWVYTNYVNRHDTRQAAWQMPGWDETVRRTVPLIRHMEAKILKPTNFSPLQ